MNPEFLLNLDLESGVFWNPEYTEIGPECTLKGTGTDPQRNGWGVESSDTDTSPVWLGSPGVLGSIPAQV